MRTIRSSLTRLSVAAAVTLALGIVGAGPAHAGSQAWSGRAAEMVNDERAGEDAAIQSSHHGIHDSGASGGGLDGSINAI